MDVNRYVVITGISRSLFLDSILDVSLQLVPHRVLVVLDVPTVVMTSPSKGILRNECVRVCVVTCAHTCSVVSIAVTRAPVPA